MAHNTLQGVIKRFNPQSGWGFIDCPQTFNMYGKDLLILKSDLNGAAQGDTVRFTVAQDDKGLKAVNVQRLGAASGSAVKHFVPHAQPAQHYVPHTSSRPQQVRQSQQALPPNHFTGTVKRFNPQAGWGFIDCAETFSLYGKDILLLKTDLNGANMGDTVSFSVTEDHKGLKAVNVNVAGPGRSAGVRRGPPGKGAGVNNVVWDLLGQLGQALGADLGALTRAAATAAPQLALATGQGPQGGAPQMMNQQPSSNANYIGTVKNINSEKGWAFLDCETTKNLYQKDVFVLQGKFEGLTLSEGDVVAFKANQTPKGPQAESVKVLPPGVLSTEDVQGVSFAGQVKSFGREKGWGLITSDEVQQLFGGDVFFHKNMLGDSSQEPNPGDQVQFTVTSHKGKLSAMAVSPGGYQDTDGGYEAMRSTPDHYARPSPY